MEKLVMYSEPALTIQPNGTPSASSQMKLRLGQQVMETAGSQERESSPGT